MPRAFGAGSSPGNRSEAVVAEVDPPNPIVAVKFSHGQPTSSAVRKAAKNIKHDNWGVYQYWSEAKEWTTEHKESSAQFPRLNADPITAPRKPSKHARRCPPSQSRLPLA